MEGMSSPVYGPSVRPITNTAIWMASDWFQYGSTKSNNRRECQNNQSSELYSQQPISSILIKLEVERELEAPSVLHPHGPAWQWPRWILFNSLDLQETFTCLDKCINSHLRIVLLMSLWIWKWNESNWWCIYLVLWSRPSP